MGVHAEVLICHVNSMYVYVAIYVNMYKCT